MTVTTTGRLYHNSCTGISPFLLLKEHRTRLIPICTSHSVAAVLTAAGSFRASAVALPPLPTRGCSFGRSRMVNGNGSRAILLPPGRAESALQRALLCPLSVGWAMDVWKLRTVGYASALQNPFRVHPHHHQQVLIKLFTRKTTRTTPVMFCCDTLGIIIHPIHTPTSSVHLDSLGNEWNGM